MALSFAFLFSSTLRFKIRADNKIIYFLVSIDTMGHPVSVHCWGLLDSPAKMYKFQEVSGMRPGSGFPPESRQGNQSGMR